MVARSAIPYAKPQRTSPPGTPPFRFAKEWGNETVLFMSMHSRAGRPAARLKSLTTR